MAQAWSARNRPHLLEKAQKEMGTNGSIPPELKEEMFVTYPPFRDAWRRFEERVEEGVKKNQQKIEL